MYNPNAKNIDFKKCRQNDEDDKKIGRECCVAVAEKAADVLKMFRACS
jgi:hypothetical protein